MDSYCMLMNSGKDRTLNELEQMEKLLQADGAQLNGESSQNNGIRFNNCCQSQWWWTFTITYDVISILILSVHSNQWFIFLKQQITMFYIDFTAAHWIHLTDRYRFLSKYQTSAKLWISLWYLFTVTCFKLQRLLQSNSTSLVLICFMVILILF